jgi:beta-glucanase (GH16 family)
MKYSLVILAGLYIFSCGNTTKSELIWADEFDYAGQPDSLKWNYETGDGCPKICGWGNNEAQVYTKNPENVRVENGSLIIDAVKTSKGWTSGRITSQSKMHFKYGRVEFRAKLPAGAGTWPALWLLGAKIETTEWPACGEIDVMEHVGRNPGVVESALHTPSSFANTVNKGSTTVDTFQSDFHIYEVKWTPDRIQFLVDGLNFYTYQPSVKTATNWPFDDPFFIIMNLAIGGNKGGHAIDPALTEAHMDVDYVRVYR